MDGGGGGKAAVAPRDSYFFLLLTPENSIEISHFNLYSVSFHVFCILYVTCSGNIVEAMLC